MKINLESVLKLWKMLSERGLDATEEITQLLDQDAEAWREGELTKGVPKDMPDVLTPPAAAPASASAPALPPDPTGDGNGVAQASLDLEAFKSVLAPFLEQLVQVGVQIDGLKSLIDTLTANSVATATEIGQIRTEVSGVVEKAQQAVETADAAVRDARKMAGQPLTPEMATVVNGAKGSQDIAFDLFAGSSVLK